MMDELWLLLTVSPISELRGGIPLGISQGIDLRLLLPTCIILNSLVYFPVAEILKRIVGKIKLADRYIDNVRNRGEKYVNKYGSWSLLFFVGIPLPFTGVYTATILSYLFGIKAKTSYLAMLLGCCMSAGIVTTITMEVISL